ncbi:glycosyltransferase family 2 protein [Sporosarcina thermotolerans]|uniref:glycosyltransferase family 2 protein n=1 Tax=Sporosarcina thermotolerans TaxID=633404 RepID=UPI0024BC236B|nr:glycosyltransferase family 2 protein [Sporosarcina thermotolerans]WHT47941.1 glycosyltransferase family 2 protein [Sporosarcina thermotolerans]
MQPILSVCIIMKNEEKVIGRCLESISGIADEIIIVDTGSKDQSKEIALQFTDKVFDFQWVNDFSKARNFAASKARGEWILAIDADEYVDRDSFEKFKNDLLSKPPVFNIIGVQIVSFIGQNGQNTSLTTMNVYIKMMDLLLIEEVFTKFWNIMIQIRPNTVLLTFSSTIRAI